MQSNDNITNPPAFPTLSNEGYKDGMTLWDFYAGQAMAAIIIANGGHAYADSEAQAGRFGGETYSKITARDAGIYANAMLQARADILAPQEAATAPPSEPAGAGFVLHLNIPAEAPDPLVLDYTKECYMQDPFSTNYDAATDVERCGRCNRSAIEITGCNFQIKEATNE